MHQAKWIANAMLAVVVLLFLGTFPWREDLYIGWIWHISGAAMVGGLADWYAVTALFSKPLGIGYKTNILPRNRNKMISMAHHMVMEELLTTNHMYKVIKNSHLADTLLMYIVAPKGRKMVRTIISYVREVFKKEIVATTWLETVRTIVQKGGESIALAPLLTALARNLLEPTSWGRIWKLLNQALQSLLASQVIRPYLVIVIRLILENYKESTMLRSLVINFMDQEEQIEAMVDAIQEKGVAYLKESESGDSEFAKYVRDSLEKGIHTYMTSPEWEKQVAFYKDTYIERIWNQEADSVHWEMMMDQLLQQAEPALLGVAEKWLYHKEKRRSIERIFLYQMQSLLKSIRPLVERVVMKELQSYSATTLTALAKEKVQGDLQIIRMNGSLMGGLLGGIFYICHLLLGGVR